MNKFSHVYLLCPANHLTGGPEAIHQLAGAIKANGGNASVMYHKSSGEAFDSQKEYLKAFDTDCEISKQAYGHYKYDIATTIPKSKDVLVIIPETVMTMIQHITPANVGVWWLSVDNANSTDGLGSVGGIEKLKEMNNIHHFTQSVYAEYTLMNNDIHDIHRLYDYTIQDYITKKIINKRKDIVLYNPAKGLPLAKEFLKFPVNAEFIPIENMDKKEIKKLMQTAKVYIDFGNHPGKDRLPREAAASGMVVFAHWKGAAQFYNDVAIDKYYKFSEGDLMRGSLNAKVNQALTKFEHHQEQMAAYRRIISTEKEEFNLQVKRIFGN